MTYEEALEYIHSVDWKGCTPGLSRIKELLEYMGNPQNECRYIHIAGTNGKGSTCAMLASVLKEAGIKTGQYTSPHIYEFNERMQVNGEYISNDELVEIVEYIKPFAAKMANRCTEFEMISAIAFEYFKRKQCEIVVLEVGLGGLMDSTNVISTPLAAVIMAIGLDHTGLLGNTVEEIAAEKAGIIKEKGTAVLYSQKPSVNQVFIDKCNETESRYTFNDLEMIKPVSRCLDYQVFDYKGYKNLQIPLTGTYQLKNASMVLEVIEALKLQGFAISEEAVRNGLMATKWPSRFQVFSKEPVIIVDGAHNPQGIMATAESLKEHFGEEKIIFIIGVMDDKDLDDMIPHIAPFAEEFITVTPDYAGRALKAEALSEYLMKFGLPVYTAQSVDDAVSTGLDKAGKDGVICALGSLYLSAEVYESLKKIKK